MKYKLLFAFILLLTISTASALNCGDQVRVDTVLEKDMLCQNTALTLNRSHTTIDCKGHTIYGKGVGNGIEVIGTAATIKNCKIDGFENGLVMTQVSSVLVDNSQLLNNLIGAHLFETESIEFKNNIIANNTFYGLYIKDSVNVDHKTNTFSGNRQDTYDLLTEIEEEPQQPEPEPEQPVVTIEQTEQPPEQPQQEPPAEPETQPPASIVEEKTPEPQTEPRQPKTIPLEVELDKKQQKQIQLNKEATITEGKTEFDLTVIPKKDLKQVQITEEIPQEVAETSREIRSNTPFIVLKEGDNKHGPTIRFDISGLKQDQAKTVKYSINKELLSEFVFRPTTFILIEEAINPGALWSIRFLFSIMMILAATAVYLSRTTHQHHHYVVHLVIFCACILVFVLFNLKVEIILTETINNIIATSTLSVLTLILIYNNIKYYKKYRSLSKEEREVEEIEF